MLDENESRKARVVPPDGADEPARITLSARDWEAFAAALDNPPGPNAALRDLMREFGPWPAADAPK